MAFVFNFIVPKRALMIGLPNRSTNRATAHGRGTSKNDPQSVERPRCCARSPQSGYPGVHGKSVSMTGEPGSGKSKLIKTLLSGLEQKSFRQDRPSVKS
jgi:hypothetical protein